MMKIPQYDLDGLGGEFKVTEELEKSIASYFGVKHCVMVNSGTAAIFLALKAVGAKKVAIPPLTMMGTAVAAELAGCEIVFVSGSKLPEGVDTYLHVSLNGRDCGIDDVIRNNPGIVIVEDACQSFGSRHDGKFLGTFGKIGCFSFSPHKIISAGNGGCIVTNDDDLAREVRKLKNFGRESGGGDRHDSLGYNFKFTDIQAQFMVPQFKDIEGRKKKKKEIYESYYARLGNVMRPHEDTPWFVDVYVENRDALIEHLQKNGIGTRGMYPLLIEQKPFSGYKIQGDSSVDEEYSHKGIWLPSSLNLSSEEIDYVAQSVSDWLGSQR